MYSKVTRKPCSLHSGPPATPSTHLAQCPIILVSLTVFLLLATSLWLFCNYQFVPLNPFTFFTTLPKSHPSDSCQSVHCLWVCSSFIYLFFRFHTEVKSYGICLSLTGFLTLEEKLVAFHHWLSWLSILLRVLTINECWILATALSASNVVYHIARFVDVESTLYPWSKSHWSWCMILLMRC